MNTATITDLAWEGAQLAFRLIMAARSRRDAEAIVHQLRALGETPRSDVAGIAAEAELRLRQDEPTQSSPVEKRRHAPDFVCGSCKRPLTPLDDPDACQECHRMPCVCDVRPLIGGPLGEGD